MNFSELLDSCRSSATEKEKGGKFEKLMKRFFQNDNRYRDLLENVWLWNEFPYKDSLGSKDLGIDLVAKTVEGKYWAIQCKCYAKDTVIDKKAVDSFLSTSSRGFGENGKEKFSQRIWVSTSNKWGANAEETLRNQNPPVIRLNTDDLENSSIDWGALYQDKENVARKAMKPMEHQKEAVKKAVAHYAKESRGKLIMACGTGKTFTSLLISEAMVKDDGFILFMVPSIALLGQSLNSWMANTSRKICPIGVCSDSSASELSFLKNDGNDEVLDDKSDIPIPATTNANVISYQVSLARKRGAIPVIFSTYQSIDVVSKAQKQILKDNKNAFGVFDLIVCDEAHRTTGVKYGSSDESDFIKIHDDKNIQGSKRLYMTATPRVYGESAKSKAKEVDDCVLFSMDNTDWYGEEFYRVGFGYAVDHGLLTDYKVLVLSVNEYDLPPYLRRLVSKDGGNELDFDEPSKMVGVISALSKMIQGDNGVTWNTDPCIMKRAVAFCQKIGTPQSIGSSKNFEKVMPYISEEYAKEVDEETRKRLVSIECRHVDGGMSAANRTETLNWLKEDTPNNECRIVTNVRCLSEGVDVPALDAVIFMSPRNSQVDVVQSVGRVMRTFKKGSPNEKKYGYIIIPVVVPLEKNADEALDDNKRFRVVWDILNALRSHDDRFNAEVQSVALNKHTPPRIITGIPGGRFKGGSPGRKDGDDKFDPQQVEMRFEEFQASFKARLVEKVGEKYYWENWAKSVGEIAQKFIVRINNLLEGENKTRTLFDKYLNALKKNINSSVSEEEAVQMLAQHMITQPVFNALFADYKFADNNSISKTMERVIKELRKQGVDEETEELEKFYESVKTNVGQIDNLEGKQKVIKELYEKFFKSAFPKTVEKLGIVYTPIECVDFILHSVDVLLNKEFGTRLTNQDVHITDPFTGTGTFITRLLQSGLIKKDDLKRKYQKEIHCNEIVLLAYYIADVNIESVYHELNDSNEYLPYNGICLTDTFQSAEFKDGTQGEAMLDDYFADNYKELQKQRKIPVRVVIGNPPYSVGQKKANDNAQNLKYPVLDARIEDTYAKHSAAGLKKSYYNSYVKAFRWASDKIAKNKEGGIVAFISNGNWLDKLEGMRKCFAEEFTSIWVFNLRGNQRTSGELSRKEGGKIFGEGCRDTIAITFLVNNPQKKGKPCEIKYCDIGDYLDREEKLSIVKSNVSIQGAGLKWETITPNEKHDWINQRGGLFDTLTPLAPEKKFDSRSKSFFVTNAIGIGTNRDAWVYSFGQETLLKRMKKCISFYNSQVRDFKDSNKSVDSFIETDPTKISWTRGLKGCLAKHKEIKYSDDYCRYAVYRPFCKQHLYAQSEWIESFGLSPKLFPNADTENRVICVSGSGSSKDFTALMTDSMTGLDTIEKNQMFPLYYWEEPKGNDLFSALERKDGITQWAHSEAKRIYGSTIKKEQIFYYVYGLLHSKSYRDCFRNDLKKSLPKILFVSEYDTFKAFEKAGRDLAELHLNYETHTKRAKGVKVEGDLEFKNRTDKVYEYFRIHDKMRFRSKGDKSTIVFNGNITITNIPERAYDYIVNGKSAIEWIMERYVVKVDEESQIKNDCNDWALEHESPRYILDLLLSVIDISIRTMDIVDGLPKIDFGE